MTRFIVSRTRFIIVKDKIHCLIDKCKGTAFFAENQKSGCTNL